VTVEVIEALGIALESQCQLGEGLTSSDLSGTTTCPGWSVFDVMNHSIGVTLKFTEFASGATNRPRTPAGDLVGDRLGPALRMAADTSRTAWSAADMSRACRLPFGTVSSETAAGINLVDVLAHGFDVGEFGDVAFSCQDEVWRTGLVVAQRLIGDDRDPLHYGAEVAVSDSAPTQRRFLGYLGRH
jgi:uncharacterized protein (TIGR03086 family)